ncbi:Crp/Fnr family transcriptional regulator [Allosediminivita pacifica]|uniref:CRP-like cAMP-binding protein n=1 Tax=Allosediminivita pacifica TaxID=1267769 RepID=A0A2T6AX64_9RHOB|nr:Crp/Fnr family transcriptional regulator [Allosediminivita pacifica]PTX48405.1 CRP-like cAMP-binding protein [Allosediminivita pacifica]GGB10749.1 transcriptional regulator [Allosediminivita pacifica]
MAKSQSSHRKSQSATTVGDPAPVLEVLSKLGRTESVPPGRTLFRQGDLADALYVLQSGSLEVSILSEEGRKLTLNHMTAGTIFGEIGLMDSGPRSATVTADDACEILKVPREVLLNEIRANPDFALAIIQLCVERLRWVSSQLEEHVFLPLPVRMARRLEFLMRSMDRGPEIPISQSALADHVGVTREAVAKVLSEWKASGMVAPGRGKIQILDAAALREMTRVGQV